MYVYNIYIIAGMIQGIANIKIFFAEYSERLVPEIVKYLWAILKKYK
jgi:hypothetical protein